MGMTFGQAHEAMKAGKKLHRPGWSGKGMFVVHMSELVIPADMINARLAAHLGREKDIRCRGYLGMMLADGSWQVGWQPSQMDMEATDWEVLS